MTDTAKATCTRYRVIKITTVGFGQSAAADEGTMWEGKDPDVLSRQFPPSNVMGADLLGNNEIDGGLIRTDFRFERQTNQGVWKGCRDPRRRITPITERGREIDLENRRQFPGDFFNGCNNCGGRNCDGC